MALRPKVAVVSDDEVLRTLLCDLLRGEGLDVREIGHADLLRRDAAGRPPGLVVLDAILGGPDGRALLDRLPFTFHGVPLPAVLLLVSSAAAPELIGHRSVSAVVEAPFSSSALLAAVADIVPLARSQTRLRVATPDPHGP